MHGLRIVLLISIALCGLAVLACLFADFTDAGDSFYETYARLDVVMTLACVALMACAFLAAIGVARERLERVTIWLSGVPFAFFGGFVALEFWGEIEPGSYVAAVFSALGLACAFALAVLPATRAEAKVARPAMQPALPTAGWYPDPAGGPGRRFWDGRQWTSQTG